MSEQCTLCGAILPAGKTCQTINSELLLFDFDPANAIPHSIHFLRVTCFMIQHQLYSDEGLAWAQSMLQANLAEDMTEQQHLQLLRTRGKDSAAGTRTWKFKRAADARPLPGVAWSMTTVDVAAQAHNTSAYCEQVKAWAHATLQEMTPLLPA